MKRKTRFTVTTSAGHRMLFSIRENKSGDLSIILRRGIYSEHPAVTGKEIKEERFSLHVSPSSHGTTIKHTLLLKDGGELTNALFVSESKSEFLTPVFAVKCSDLRPEFYAFTPNGRDPIVCLCDLKGGEEDATFMYGVMASLRGAAMPEVPGTLGRRVDYQHFSIAVYSAVIDAPPLPFTDFALPVSSNERLNGVQISGVNFSGLGTRSFSAVDAADTISSYLKTLTGLHLKRWTQIEADEAPGEFSQMPERFYYFFNLEHRNLHQSVHFNIKI